MSPGVLAQALKSTSLPAKVNRRDVAPVNLFQMPGAGLIGQV